jgi:hypothetical protein
MKPFIPYSLLAAAALCGVALGQSATTTPVGYVTQTLPANQFSFIGLTLHNSVEIAGVLDSSTSNSVTDNGVDFSAILEAGATYILELPSGVIQEITAWNASGVLTTSDDISASVVDGTTTYKLRKAATISDIFGADNSAGLTPDEDGDYLSGNDIVFVPTAGGDLVQIFFFDDGAGTTGWFDSGFGDAANFPIVYADGFYVQRTAGAPIELVTSGEVKTVPTSSMLLPSWNFVSSVAPVGLTLGNSGLEAYVSADSEGDYLAVDNIFIPNVDGSFTVAFYFDDGDTTGWFDIGFGDASDFALEGGFLILNRGGSKPYTISVPTSYSSL